MMKFVFIFLLAIAAIAAEKEAGKHHHHHHHHHHSHTEKPQQVTTPVSEIQNPDGNVSTPQVEQQTDSPSVVNPGTDRESEQQPGQYPDSGSQTESVPKPEQVQDVNQESNPEQQVDAGQYQGSNFGAQSPDFGTQSDSASDFQPESEQKSEQEKIPDSDTTPWSSNQQSQQRSQPRPGNQNNEGSDVGTQFEKVPANASREYLDDLTAKWTTRLRKMFKEFEDRGESAEFWARFQIASTLFWTAMNTSSDAVSDLRSRCTPEANTSVFGRIVTKWTDIFGVIERAFVYVLKTPIRLFRWLTDLLTNIINRIGRFFGLVPPSNSGTQPGTGPDNNIISIIFRRLNIKLASIWRGIGNVLGWIGEILENIFEFPVELAGRVDRSLKRLEYRVLIFFGLEPDSESDEQPGQGTQPNQGTQPGQGSQPGQGTQPGQDSQPGQGSEPGQGSQPGQGTQPGQETNSGQNSHTNSALSGNSYGAFFRRIFSRWSRLFRRIVQNYQNKLTGLGRRLGSVGNTVSFVLTWVWERFTDKLEIPLVVAWRVERFFKSVERRFLNLIGLDLRPESSEKSGTDQSQQPGQETNPGERDNSGNETRPGDEIRPGNETRPGDGTRSDEEAGLDGHIGIERKFLPLGSFLRRTFSRWSTELRMAVEHFRNLFNGIWKRYREIVEHFQRTVDSHKGWLENVRGFGRTFKEEFHLPTVWTNRFNWVQERIEGIVEVIEDLYKSKFAFPAELARKVDKGLRNIENRFLGLFGIKPETQSEAENLPDQRSLQNSYSLFFRGIIARWTRYYHMIIERFQNLFRGIVERFWKVVGRIQNAFDSRKGWAQNFRAFWTTIRQEIHLPARWTAAYERSVEAFRRNFDLQRGFVYNWRVLVKLTTDKLNSAYTDLTTEFREIIQNFRDRVSSKPGFVDKLRGFVGYLEYEFHLPKETARTFLNHLENFNNGLKVYLAPGGEYEDVVKFLERKWSIVKDKIEEFIGLAFFVDGKIREVGDKVGSGGAVVLFNVEIVKSIYETFAGIFKFFKGLVNTAKDEFRAIIEDIFHLFTRGIYAIVELPKETVSHVVFHKHQS